MNRFCWLLTAFLSSIAIDGLISFYGRSEGQWDYNPLRFLVILAVLSSSCLIHSRKRRTSPDSCRQKRQACFDWLRILAAVLVISVHTFDKTAAMLPERGPAQNLFLAASVLCLTCNLIYVMLSGALLLQDREERLSSFYWNRFLKAAVPLFCYYLIYAAVHGGLQNLYPARIPALIKQILAGPFPGAPHFWLIYVILSLYLLVPFFRVMVNHLTISMLRGLVVLILLFQAACAYLPYLGLSLGIEFMLPQWMGVMILGYFFTRPESRSWQIPILFFAAASAVFSVWAVFSLEQYSGLLLNTVPTMTAMASGIFILFIRFREKLPCPGVRFSALSRYSYSIILIHWYVLYYLVGDRFLTGSSVPALAAGAGLTILSTMGISLIFSWIYDNVVVILFQTVLSRLAYLPKGLE